MIDIIINNSYSQITGLNTHQFNGLKKVLSYSIDAQAAYFSNNQFNTLRYLIDKHGNFPTGLLYQVLDYLLAQGLKYNPKDLRVRPTAHKTPRTINLPVTPYKAQLDALNAALLNDQGTLSLPTGSGKSLVIALITQKLNVPTLIIVPNIEIKRQLQASFDELFENTKNITIKNIDASDLEEHTEYGCLIIDEAHHSAAKTYQNLNKKAWSNIFYRFFVTATPFRNNKDENLLFQAIAGTMIYELTYKTAIKEGYIVPIEAYYIELPKVKTDAFTWAEVYSELVVNNEYRNRVISDLLITLYKARISTLCLIKEVKHGGNLVKSVGFPFSNGQDEDSRQFIEAFNKGKINILIGTTGIIGEGVDTKPCEYVIIAGLGKAKSAFMQQVGRAVRTYLGKESAKVIIFKDTSHRFTQRHFREQCKILKDEYGVIPIKLDLYE